MAYNYFPTSYQPMMYQNPMGQPQVQQMQQQPQQNQQPLQNNNIVWVSGETGAKSYLLTPNTTLPLWDSERQTIYLKSTDASGMPSMKILDYVIRDTTQPQAVSMVTQHSETSIPSPDFVTHDELKELEERIAKRLEQFKPSEQRPRRKLKEHSEGDDK